MKLYSKFILAYIAYGIAAFILIATLSASLTHKYLIESRSDTLYDEATLIANTYSAVYTGQSIDLTGTAPQIKAASTFLDAEIWIVDRDGTIAADSQGRRQGTVIRGFDPTAAGNKSYMTGRYFDSFPYDVLSVSAPITGNYQTYGYVVIHLPMDRVNESEYRILNIVYTTSAIVFLLSFILLLVFQTAVYRPLRRITEAAKHYAAGDLKYRAGVTSRDEMGYLADTLDYMSSELDKADEYQHTFIANISHDFRSPLTSIKGYLEAIQDGTIPPERQGQYIDRVLNETERLAKLTSSMLTLNTLDSEGFLNRTNFDINRVIKSTAASFEGQCLEKNITIELIFEQESEMVYADYAKIQQVLYNLTDNAVKFSHSDASIYLSSYEKREKIYISVKDTGIGIAKKDQKKIFDRFYKSDSSRGKDKRGTGLGLAIVREIVQAHEENIDVISTEGVGTEFVFSLPAAQTV